MEITHGIKLGRKGERGRPQSIGHGRGRLIWLNFSKETPLLMVKGTAMA